MSHLCITKHPSFEEQTKLAREWRSFNGKTRDGPITIGVIFHICYFDSSANYNADIAYAIDLLNKDFNKTPDNFNSGVNVYKTNAPTLRLLSYKTYLKYRKYIRITRQIRRNRQRYLRTLRINVSRRRINERRRRINTSRRRINNQRRKINKRRIRNYNRKYGSNILTIKFYKDLYNNYVSLAEASGITFQLINTIYNLLSSQSADDLTTLDNNIKINGSPAVQSDIYLNIWVVNMTSGILGYGQFPWEGNVNTDGIVLNRSIFGRNPTYNAYNLNKTLPHEVGHWLGLYHNFQTSFGGQIGKIDTNMDGILSGGETTGDLVADTPPQTEPTYGNPYTNKNTFPSSFYNGQRIYHMYMNYMDYTDDINMFMFTKEQVTKMRKLIDIYRSNYIL